MATFILKFRQKSTDSIIKSIQFFGGEIEYVSPVLPIIAFQSDQQTVRRIREHVACDYLFKAPDHGSLLEHGSLTSHYTPLNIVPKVDASRLRSAGLTGWGVVVAILDSGISEEWVRERHDFTGFGSQPVIDHGNKVANIIKRFARGSRLISCKVGQNYHDLKLTDVLKAIDFAISQQVHVVNMSLGFEIENCRRGHGCPLCDVVNYYTHHNGVLFVAAGGNDGEEGSIRCPGRSFEVITVGSIKQQSLAVADYSSKGLPGFNKPNILTSGSIYFDGKYDEGTSYSAPLIAGVSAALMTGAQMSVAKVKQLLYTSAERIERVPEHHQGFGVFSIEKLMEVLENEKSIAASEGQEPS